MPCELPMHVHGSITCTVVNATKLMPILCLRGRAKGTIDCLYKHFITKIAKNIKLYKSYARYRFLPKCMTLVMAKG